VTEKDSQVCLKGRFKPGDEPGQERGLKERLEGRAAANGVILFGGKDHEKKKERERPKRKVLGNSLLN